MEGCPARSTWLDSRNRKELPGMGQENVVSEKAGSGIWDWRPKCYILMA